MPAPTHITGSGLYERRCRVSDADVVWVRAIIEAYDGLGYLFGDGSGVIILTTTDSLARELDALVETLAREAALQPIPG